MKTKEIIQIRKDLLKQKEEEKNAIDQKWTDAMRAYIATNCEFKTGQVVDVIPYGKKKPIKRLVIYDIQTRSFDENHVSICLLGWYLNADNNPIKWDGGGIFLTGTSFAPTVTLSQNQTSNPVQK